MCRCLRADERSRHLLRNRPRSSESYTTVRLTVRLFERRQLEASENLIGADAANQVLESIRSHTLVRRSLTR
jgi:hypothetical protein